MSAPQRTLAVLHTEASLGWGGQEIRILTEAAGVARRGHRVLLAAPPEARIFAEAKRYGVEAVALPIGRKRPGGVLAMRRLLQGERFDVVNTHSSTDTWLTALACATLPAPPPLVRTRHISAPLPRNASTRWLYAKATRFIVTTGEKLRRQVGEETGVPLERVKSIPTGIDLARYRPGDAVAARRALGIEHAGPIVGIVATLRSWKGHGYLLRALEGLARPDVLLLIVGDGPQREALQVHAAELGLAERVRFAGNQADVAPWMQAMDLFCLPSYANEGVPQALMQAMACGLPVISTPVGSIAEIVADGDSGILVAPRDAEALARAIAALLDDRVLRMALAARARTLAEERFGEDLMVQRMLDVFQAVAAPRG